MTDNLDDRSIGLDTFSAKYLYTEEWIELQSKILQNFTDMHYIVSYLSLRLFDVNEANSDFVMAETSCSVFIDDDELTQQHVAKSTAVE